jgi:hypothetical protein
MPALRENHQLGAGKSLKAGRATRGRDLFLFVPDVAIFLGHVSPGELFGAQLQSSFDTLQQPSLAEICESGE